MSKLAEFKALEAQLAAQLKQLDALKNDDKLKREIEFEEKLRNLMGQYDVGLREIISILDPQPSRTSISATPAPSNGSSASSINSTVANISPPTISSQAITFSGG